MDRRQAFPLCPISPPFQLNVGVNAIKGRRNLVEINRCDTWTE